MAHFAEIDENNLVVRVLVVPDEQEHRGQEYLATSLALGGRWIQTSYNNKIRKQYASANYFYDESLDIFIKPKPAEWFYLDENYDWQCPIGIHPTEGRPLTQDEWMWLEIIFGKQN